MAKIRVVPLKIVFIFSRFNPTLNWNWFLMDLRRGSNSLNSDSVPSNNSSLQYQICLLYKRRPNLKNLSRGSKLVPQKIAFNGSIFKRGAQLKLFFGGNETWLKLIFIWFDLIWFDLIYNVKDIIYVFLSLRLFNSKNS